MSDQDVLTIWKISHLLFPNATQAKSFYYEFIQRSGVDEDNIKFDQKTIGFLYFLYLKTPVFKSAHGFIEVENISLTRWPQFSKKLSKLEQFILLSFLVLKIDSISLGKILKIDVKTVRLKFRKALQKEFPYPKIDEIKSNQIFYKKWSDSKVVPFFVRESIIDHIFLDNEITTGIKNPIIPEQLIQYQEQLVDFKRNFEKLAIDPRSIPNREQSTEAQKNSNKKRAFNNSLRKYFLSVAAILGSVVIILFLRPNIIQQIITDEPLQIVELQQVHFSKKDMMTYAESEQISGDSKLEKSIPVAAEAQKVKTVVATVEKQKETEIQTEKTTETKKIVTKNSGVFRGIMHVNDIHAVSQLVREKLINLGGQKAGEVELGWMKNDKTSYFHFILPQNNQNSFSEFLNQFGKIQIKFEPHPRVLPAGKSRYIIEIKDNE